MYPLKASILLEYLTTKRVFIKMKIKYVNDSLCFILLPTFCGFTSVADYVKTGFILILFFLANGKLDFTTNSAIA